MVRTLEISPLLMSAMDIFGKRDGKKTLKKSATKKEGYATSKPFIVFDSPIITPISVKKQISVNKIKSHDGVNVKKSIYIIKKFYCNFPKSAISISNCSIAKSFSYRAVCIFFKLYPFIAFSL
jgi:hypothetical protein